MLATCGSWPLRVDSAKEVNASARELYAHWMAPLVPFLENVDDFVVLPAGPLLGVPIETLIDDDGQYLADRFAISYAPSATIYAWLREKETGERSLANESALLVGNPPFEPDQLHAMEAMSSPSSVPPGEKSAADGPLFSGTLVRSLLAGDAHALASLPRLPATRAEVQRIAQLFPRATVLLGPLASEQRLDEMVRSGEFGAYRTIHLATHAFVDDDRPEHSALILSLADLPDPLEALLNGERICDGLITVEEITCYWRLGAEIVTLSACQSAIGKEVTGEGYIGLAYAFLQAGARSLLVSLWKVDDEATARLMTRFYENLTGAYSGERGGFTAVPMSKLQALKEAKHWLRSYTDTEGRPSFRHPAYWPGFVLVGDTG